MVTHRGVLSIVLLLMPICILLDGLIIPLVTGFLLFMFVWPQKHSLSPIVLRQIDREALLIVALLLVWPFISSFWALSQEAALSTVARVSCFVLLGLLGLTLIRKTTPNDDTKPLECFAIGIILAAFSVALETLPGGGLLMAGAKLLQMTPTDYYDKSVNKGICELTLLAWVGVIAFKLSKHDKLALWMPWLVMPSILYLHSLTAKTGALAAIAVFTFMRLWPQLGKKLVAWGLPLLFATWPIIIESMKPILTNRLIYRELPTSSQHRIGIWNFVMERWYEKPLLGWGADSSRIMPGGNDAFQPYMANLPLHPHNIPLQVLLEHGLVGFMLYCTAMFLFVRRVVRYMQFDPVINAAIGAMMAAYITMCLSGFSMWQSWWVITPILLCLLTTFFLSEHPSAKKS